MQANMSGVDKTVRLLIAFIIAMLYFSNMITGNLALILGVVAAIFVLTSLISFCPLYTLFKFSTKK